LNITKVIIKIASTKQYRINSLQDLFLERTSFTSQEATLATYLYKFNRIEVATIIVYGI